jgi:hypothetical protein
VGGPACGCRLWKKALLTGWKGAGALVAAFSTCDVGARKRVLGSCVTRNAGALVKHRQQYHEWWMGRDVVSTNMCFTHLEKEYVQHDR